MRIFVIALKDLRIFLARKETLILALLAPFLLTLGMGFIGGAFSPGGSGSGAGYINLGFADLDKSPATEGFFQGFSESEGFVRISRFDTSEAAENAVEAKEIDAALVIPEGFTNSTIRGGDAGKIEVLTDPGKEISGDIAVSIAKSFTSRLLAASVGLREAASWLQREEELSASRAFQRASQLIPAVMSSGGSGSVKRSGTETGRTFDLMEYFAPGFAVLFLLLTVTAGTRSILDERREGTLARMSTTPSRRATILAGKMTGVFITGVFQVSVIIGATTFLFGLEWGSFLGVVLLILGASCACSGWGMIIAAFAKTSAQVSGVGASMMLVFGILGGTFIPIENFPEFLQYIARITPNFWAIRGFSSLASGAVTADILGNAGIMALTGLVLLGVSALIFARGKNTGKMG